MITASVAAAMVVASAVAIGSDVAEAIDRIRPPAVRAALQIIIGTAAGMATYWIVGVFA